MPEQDNDYDVDGALIVSETTLIKITDVDPPTEARLAAVQETAFDRASEYMELYNALDSSAKTAFLLYLLTYDRATGLKMLELIGDAYF